MNYLIKIIFSICFLLSLTAFSAYDNYPKSLKKTTVTIGHSLFFDAKNVGISANVINKIVDVMSWKINFNNLKKGDKFIIFSNKDDSLKSVIYQSGDFIRAAFAYKNHQGKTNYFDQFGIPVASIFLKSPLKFERISSGFQKKRWHPILKSWRPHRAIDYAAKKNTPVYAAADGIVKSKKSTGVLGNVLTIQHGDGFSTIYAHLHRFSNKAKVGLSVKKSQIIGFVGSSGRSTGYHLHYELRKNGIRQNPLTYRAPRKIVIDYKDLPYFKKYANKIISNLK